jgi:hypothetical protein
MNVKKEYKDLMYEFDVFCHIYNRYFDYLIDINDGKLSYENEKIKHHLRDIKTEINSNMHKRRFIEIYKNHAQHGYDCILELEYHFKWFKQCFSDYLKIINEEKLRYIGKVSFNKFRRMCNLAHHFSDIEIIRHIKFELERTLEYYNYD